MFFELNKSRLTLLILICLHFLVFVGCGGKNEDLPVVSPSLRTLKCIPVENAKSVRQTAFKGVAGSGWIDSNQLKQKINSSCFACHGAPSHSGGFSYINEMQGRQLTLEGKTAYYPGLIEVMDKMIQALNDNSEKQMPPPERRNSNPGYFIELAKDLLSWKDQGFPEGYFSTNQTKSPLEKPPVVTGEENGDCVPTTDIVGYDYKKDRFFSKITNLPKSLFDTDLYTIDNFKLAQTGTVTYTVEYPLWADNAEKGRWVHVPMKIVDGKLIRQSIVFDQNKKEFIIPENSRFYKTFYRKVLDKNGQPYFKRIETRIVVVRYPWDQSLYGAYKWDDTEQFATLVETPYRDGTTFKDTVYRVVVDEKKMTTRTYGVPGRHRCIDCHRGSEMNNGILGFTPLQLHRRKLGEAGRDLPVFQSELNQVERLNQYGILSNAPEGPALPRMEWIGNNSPKNFYDLRAAGYFYGNCAHCHNPRGIALSKERGVYLPLMPGTTFSLSPTWKSVQIPTRSLVNAQGILDSSHIWRKVMDPPEKQGLTSQMPMHTPGAPDCRAAKVIGQWIRSYESIDAAESFEPECQEPKDIKWVDQDFTWPASEKYEPRRGDWADPEHGIPSKYKQSILTPVLQSILKEEIAVGYWSEPEKCTLPELELPPEKRRPWMMRGDKPSRPFNQIYFTTVGSFFYRNSCSKCHGRNFDGTGDLAKGILNWSGGSIRVANFIQGMFGNKGENLKLLI